MPLTNLGRTLHALALLAFGLQYAHFGHLRPGIPLMPHWLPNEHWLAYALAAVLLFGSLALLATWNTSATSLTLGLVLLVGSALDLTHLQSVLHTANGRTGFLECLSFAATALILHGLTAANRFTLHLGRILFAFAMIVFGAQHFMYLKPIANLILPWIPFHTFWVIATGVALIAAGLAIATRILDKPASIGLFVLFFGWLVLLHIPLSLAAPNNADLWSSLFVVLGLSGSSLLLTASSESSRL